MSRLRDRVRSAVERRVRTVRERTARQESGAAGGTHSVAADGTDPSTAARWAGGPVAEVALAGGYLVRAPGAPQSPFVAPWPSQQIGRHTYHSRAALTRSPAGDGTTVVLLGRPVDVEHDTADAQAIADRLASLDAADRLRDAAGLGGRWTVLLHAADGSLTVLTDALASQPVWHSGDAAVLASHEALVPGGSLLARNSLLEVSGSGAVTVRRFWPWSDGAVDAASAGPRAASPDATSVIDLVRDRLVAHTRLLTERGRPGVALTAGPASRAILAAYLAHPREGGFAFTGFAPESAREGRSAAQDLFGASELAHRVGLPHRVVRAVDPPDGSVFAEAYRLAAPRGTTAARAFARAALPPDTVELHSAGALTDLEAWESPDTDFRDGDLSHTVALPFNERGLLALLLDLTEEERVRVVDELGAGLTEA